MESAFSYNIDGVCNEIVSAKMIFSWLCKFVVASLQNEMKLSTVTQFNVSVFIEKIVKVEKRKSIFKNLSKKKHNLITQEHAF